MLRPVVTLLAVASLALAGCVNVPNDSASVANDVAGAVESLAFLPAVTVDAVRVASEPSVRVAQDGTIFVAAPTGTIKYATRPQDALAHADKGIFQGAIWRSTDDGASFEFKAGLGPTSYHTAQPGGGDSDIAIASDGTVFVTDQWGLFAEFVQFSKDNGETWNAATGTSSNAPPVDRQWLAVDPTDPNVVYLNYNGPSVGLKFSKSTDGGQTWTGKQISAKEIPPGPLVALDGGFVAFAAAVGGLTFFSSADAGETWTESSIDAGTITDFFPQTFADAAGTLYVAWCEEAEGGTAITYVVSTDRGATWSEKKVAFLQPGLGLFLWGEAGDAGKVAFSWYGTPDPEKEWYAEAAIVVDADTETPRVTQARVSDTPARVGPPCQNGSLCTSGRELGDFQSLAIGPDGKMVVVYVTVLSPEEGGRITFAKMSAGPSLIETPPAVWVV